MAVTKDSEHPFLRPLWRRITLVAVCFIWAGLEYLGGSPTWSMIALAFGGYGAWQFFYMYKSVDETAPAAEPDTKE
jgi:hypothetical protein